MRTSWAERRREEGERPERGVTDRAEESWERASCTAAEMADWRAVSKRAGEAK
jgi:hypothetical protein